MESAAPTLYARVGGTAFFERLVDEFYAGVETDQVLLPLYPDQDDLTGARRRLALFLAQYWGGPDTYLHERGHPRLRLRHMPFTVGPLERDRWLVHMSAAVETTCAEFDVLDAAAELMAYFVPAAEHLRNDTGLPITSATYPSRGPSADRLRAMPTIEVRDLRKSYGALMAVDGVSFVVEPGEVYGLLGENGAGKSTTVEILEGHRTATSGHVRVLDVDPAVADRSFRDRIGIVLQSSGIEEEFTVREVIDLYGACYRHPRPLEEVVHLVGLEHKVDERIGTLSGGQKRRIDLALGILGRPDVLFLDEPTTGFDPAARRRSWELVEALGVDGTTVLLTTHYLDEAEHLADRVGVLSRGRLVAEGTPEALINTRSGTEVSFVIPAALDDGGDVVERTAALLGVPCADVRRTARTLAATVDRPTEAVHRLTGWALEAGIELDSLRVRRASLEDVYLGLQADVDAETSMDASAEAPTSGVDTP